MPINSTTRACLTIATLGLIAFCLATWITKARAQQVTSSVGLGFNAQLETYPPPHEMQIKTSLEGEKAEPQSGGHILLTEAKLKSFATNGVLEMQAHAPQCIFDTMQRTVSSTGRLQIQMVNGRFLVEGKGFLMQTNGSLILSNQVHTVIRNFPGKFSKP
jgi:hypothetical protein